MLGPRLRIVKEDRCLQTAAPTAKALGIPIFVEYGAPVILGNLCSPYLTGLHPRPGSLEFLHSFFPEVATEGWPTVFYPPRKGEDVEAVHERASATLCALLTQLERASPNKHQTIVLFTHAATAIALARGLLDDRQREMRIGCCTLSTFQRNPDAPKDTALGPGVWTAEMIGSGAHLKEGAQRDWGFEDIQTADGKVCWKLHHSRIWLIKW
jgi:transcription factor C subunit 7